MTTITTPSLSSYELIIIADQANYWEYDQSLANTIINSWKPIIATGMSADYFCMNQDFVTLPGLSTCGSGTGLTQITVVDSGNPIWTTPNSVGISPVTVLSAGHGYYAVTKTNWPSSFATNGISIATPIGSPTWHIY